MATWRSRAAAMVLATLVAGTSRAQSRDEDALIEAVKSGSRPTVASLLKKGTSPRATSADGTTALLWAARQDSMDLVGELLRSGADVKAANRYGVTALYLACLNGNGPMVQALLDAGAEANAISSEGETALMTAARSGSVDAVTVLLKHGAAVDAREAWRGQTALMWATAQDHPDVVRLLIAHGAAVDARSTEQTWDRQRTAEPREKWLPPGGLTPLLFAARQGALASARVLLDAGAAVDAATPDGISVLLMAVINGHYDVALLAVDRGADVNAADVSGRTPLFAAVDMNTMPASNRPAPKVVDNRATALDLVRAILASGANVDAQLATQQPYRTKLDRGDDTMLTMGTTPLLRAARAGDVAAMQLLLASGADATLTTRPGINPLMAAAGLGTKEEDTVGRGKSQRQAIEAIDLCLKRGVDINAVDQRGQSALHGAAMQGYDEVVTFLASRGALLTVKDSAGHTPLDLAEGRAGGSGFDGQASNPHESTAALLRHLAAAPTTTAR